MKYQALKDSFGFQERFWAKGTQVEVPDGEEQPPTENFAPITDEIVASENAGKIVGLRDRLDHLRSVEVLTPEEMAARRSGGQPKAVYERLVPEMRSLAAQQKRQREGEIAWIQDQLRELGYPHVKELSASKF